MNNQESEKSISDKTFPMDLASKPPPTKPMETSGMVKPPLASPLTLRHAVQPNLRVVTAVPTLSQHITAGPHVISHIAPQVGVKQVDASARTHITIPTRPTTPVQVAQNATRTILTTTYQLPRGAASVSNITGPRIRPPVIQSQCQSATHISAVSSNVIAGTGNALPIVHANSNSVGPIGVTVNVPVGFVRASVPPRASSPAAGTAWIGGTVQVQTVQVCSASVISQRIPTFATVGRSTQSNLQNTRPSLLHQTSQQMNASKPVSTSGTLSVQPMTSSILPTRTMQSQNTTLVYGGSVTHTSRLHAVPVGNNSVAQRAKGQTANTRQIQVSPRAHITVPTAIGSRISTIPVVNSVGAASCNNSPHIVSYTNSLPQNQNINMSTTAGVNRVVNNIRSVQGQVLSGGNRISTNIVNSNMPQVIQSSITTANSISNTNAANIITSTNINTNNLSTNSPNISGLVQLHPAAVLVASGGTRTNNTKLLAQITQPPGIKTNGSNIMQSSIQTISLNATSGTTLGMNSSISTPVTNARIGSGIGTRIMTTVPKTYPQTSESNSNPYAHGSSPNRLGLTENKTTNSFPLTGTPYYYNTSYNAATNFPTSNTTPHSVHAVTQPVCFNPIMLVETTTSNSVMSSSEQQINNIISVSNQTIIPSSSLQQTSQVHSNPGIPTTSGSLLGVVHHSQVSVAASTNQQNTKPTSSPRPSILRKRDHEGLHLKAAKNLTPALHVITNNPPVSPQQRPDSRGNCPSSAGSTTISATSSPGLEDQEEDHKYPLNLEVNTKYTPDQGHERINEETIKYSGLNEENLRKFNMETKDQIYSIEERMKLNAPVERLHTGIRTNRDYNVLENRYKYENRINSTNDSEKKINVSLIEGDAFKTNEGNVKHEDSNSRRNLRQDDDRPVEMSPRKKPRKQQLTSNESYETKNKSDDMMFISETHVKHEHGNNQESSLDRLKEVTVRKPPSASLLSYYKQSWKSTQYHFQRYSDVKPKDERKPNIIDLANQSHVLQKINGWKIYHLSTQMEDMSEMESQVYEKLSGLLKLMEKEEAFQTKKEILTVNELIKGNMQRSKIINDGMLDAKNQMMRIFEHKANVSDIIHRCASKRNFKKRDKS